LPIKNRLTQADSEAVEAAYLAKLAKTGDQDQASGDETASNQASQRTDEISSPANEMVVAFAKPARRRSKAHLVFVASQPCLVCEAKPCDAHHLKIARPRSLGRKVSDEFTVPLCRKHHQELHRHGNEANWWSNMQIAPISLAKQLWESSPVHEMTAASMATS
jgi:hypothetical protein